MPAVSVLSIQPSKPQEMKGDQRSTPATMVAATTDAGTVDVAAERVCVREGEGMVGGGGDVRGRLSYRCGETQGERCSIWECLNTNRSGGMSW